MAVEVNTEDSERRCVEVHRQHESLRITREAREHQGLVVHAVSLELCNEAGKRSSSGEKFLELDICLSSDGQRCNLAHDSVLVTGGGSETPLRRLDDVDRHVFDLVDKLIELGVGLPKVHDIAQ